MEPYNTTRVRDFRVKEMIYQNEEKPKPREGALMMGTQHHVRAIHVLRGPSPSSS